MQTVDEMLLLISTECGVGIKQNSKGTREVWVGGSLHISVVDGDIPITAFYSGANVHDSSVALLNHEELSVENAAAIIQKYSNKIEDINSIPEEYWTDAFGVTRFSLGWKDIFTAYVSPEVDKDVLLTYLSKKSVYKHLETTELIQEDIDEGFQEEEETAYGFFVWIIRGEELSIDALRAYKNIFDGCVKFSSVEDLENGRIRLLLKLGYFCLGGDNFKALKNKLSLEEAVTLIEKNFDKFLLSDKKGYMGIDGNELLLKSEIISPEEKFEFVKLFSVPDVEKQDDFPLLYEVIIDCKDKHLDKWASRLTPPCSIYNHK